MAPLLHPPHTHTPFYPPPHPTGDPRKKTRHDFFVLLLFHSSLTFLYTNGAPSAPRGNVIMSFQFLGGPPLLARVSPWTVKPSRRIAVTGDQHGSPGRDSKPGRPFCAASRELYAKHDTSR